MKFEVIVRWPKKEAAKRDQRLKCKVLRTIIFLHDKKFKKSVKNSNFNEITEIRMVMNKPTTES